MENYFWKDIYNFFTNRLLILFLFICILFYVVVARLFDLQIVRGEEIQSELSNTVVRELTIQAPRGSIYDRYGRPLAINQTTYTVNFDLSVNVDDLNRVLLDFIKLCEENNESYVDDFPISKEEPYIFLFDGNIKREENYKKEMGLKKDDTAREAIEELRKRFKIPEDLPNSETRKLLALRSMIHMRRFWQYDPITVAFSVSDKTIAAIEEENEKYQGFFIDVSSLRYYPMGKYFSHILGRIGNLTQDDKKNDKNKEYSSLDKIGISGIELAFEKTLKGKNGVRTVEVTNWGKRVREVEEGTPAVTGNKLFLTIDARLQQKAYDILEETLTDIVRSKILGLAPKEEPLSTKSVLISILRSNNISMKNILLATEAEGNNATLLIKDYINKRSLEIAEAKRKEREELIKNNQELPEEKPVDPIAEAKDIVREGLDEGKIREQTALLVLFEQGLLVGDESYINDILKGRKSVQRVIIDMIDNGQLTPQIINLDPSSASIALVNVNTGEVLAAVGYPSYDNNMLVNNVNSDYYYKINNDLTRPVINRPFNEKRAPGSTFKMITAITGLETGVISTKTKILDEIVFTKAGVPYTKSWSPVSQGILDVRKALEVSSNYFFCDVAYSIGNQKSNNKLDSISALNKYMTAFGLNDPTGVEIGEAYNPKISNISSPELKEYTEKLQDPYASQTTIEWYDGDTVKTAIGQALNNYTTLTMAKYIATLATSGKRYKLHLMEKVETAQGELVQEYEPILETIVEMSPENIKAVHEGMILVTKGINGTARGVFDDFPVSIASKTGTAQENEKRNDHASFAGFIPVENPEVAVYCSIPFGDTKATRVPAAMASKKLLTEYLGLNEEPERITLNALNK